jgi:hypothetical protein
LNANVSYLLGENSDLVAQVMAADGDGKHSHKLLKLRQDYLLLRTYTQDREDVKTVISHSSPIGLGWGKAWPKDRAIIPTRDDVAVPADRPGAIKTLQAATTWKIPHPRWAIALTVIAALLLTAAVLTIVFTNIIGILAIGIWGYVLLFSPGAVSAIAAIALWIPRRVRVGK